MKQVFQDFKSGIPTLHTMPEPNINNNAITVQIASPILSPNMNSMADKPIA